MSFLYIPRAHNGLQYIQQEKIENSHHYFAFFFFFKSVNNEIVILINFLKKMRLFVKGKKKMKNKVHAQILRFLSKKKS